MDDAYLDSALNMITLFEPLSLVFAKTGWKFDKNTLSWEYSDLLLL